MYISLDILIEEWPAIRISVHTSQPDAPSLVRNVWRKLYSTKGRAFEVFKAVRCCFLTLEWSMCRVFDIQQPKIAPIPICQYDPTLIRPAIRFRSWLSCTRIDVGTSRIVIPLRFIRMRPVMRLRLLIPSTGHPTLNPVFRCSPRGIKFTHAQARQAKGGPKATG